MNYLEHSNLKDRHAFLSPSKFRWLDYETEKLGTSFINNWSQELGTIIHSFAEKCIRRHIKLNAANNDILIFYLAENYVPDYVINNIDIDYMYTNLCAYVNDAINFGMEPEVVLVFDERYAFGTADAIMYSSSKNQLRIHDLKTGVTAAHMEQLILYAAFFCFEYKVDPKSVEIELRIYQSNDVLIYNPTPDDILTAINKTRKCIKTLKEIENGGKR